MTWAELLVALVDLDDVTRCAGARMYGDVLVEAWDGVGHVMCEHVLPLGGHLGTLGQHPGVPTRHQANCTSTHQRTLNVHSLDVRIANSLSLASIRGR